VSLFNSEASEAEKIWVKTVSPPVAPRRTRPHWSWAIAAGLVLASAFGGWRMWRGTQPPFALLAEAYTANRTMELRWPEAKYATARLQRGPKAEMSKEILQAALEIQSGPRRAEWLRAKGRIHLLRWEPKEAMEALSEAADLELPGADLLADLGMAYFVRAEATNTISDQARAHEYLSQSLQKAPRNFATRFNRAIVRDKLGLFVQAVEDWDELLRQEPAGEWSSEARQRRAVVLERLKRVQSAEWELRAAEHLESQVLAAITGSATRSEFLASSFVKTAAERLLAAGDPWLVQLAGRNGSESLESAFQTLAGASRRRRDGGTLLSEQRVALEALMRATLPTAYRAWGAFEELYDAAHTSPIRLCPAAKSVATTALQDSGFRWLHGQVLLELSTCEVAMSNFDAADRLTRETMELARAASLPGIGARAASFQTSHLITRGRYREALQLSRAMIDSVYEQNLPRARFHNFHNDLYRAADRMGLRFTAAEGARMTAEIAQANGSSDLERLLRAAAAENFSLAGDAGAAEQELRQVEAIRKSLPSPTTMSTAELFASVALAKARRDRRGLEAMDTQVRAADNPFWRVLFDVTLASLDRQAGQPDLAEQRLRNLLPWLAANPARRGESHRWRKSLDDVYRLLTLTLLDRGLKAEALGVWEDYLRHQDQMIELAVPPARAVSPLLEVTFVRLDGRYGRWIRRGARIDFTWLALSEDELRRNSRVFRRACLDPNRPPADSRAATALLWANLIGPLELGSSAGIAFRLDGDLIGLPLHALPMPSGLPLVSTLPVIYRESSQYSARPFAPLLARGALVVAASEVPGELRSAYPPLPGLVEEAQGIAQTMSAPQLLTGESARGEEIVSRLPHTGIFHFSGHSAAGPAGVSLLLTPDSSAPSGLWQVPKQVAYAPALAVLAACATAEYEEVDSVAPRHLAHAFLRAGFGQVVAAGWNVDHVSTRRIMLEFYAGLAKGLPPAEALRQSSLAAMRSGYSHPYYFAPFAIFV